ncbi:sigma-70 family RNA polymerase sigma factor [Paenibacillus sp. IB182496]|uniref:RNA polymerase sigma factor n=1 Tax=Paenibacillus sabuli TaxID=2772509 RepID=A0A927GRF5_9BACL|nr:sigma-70 family RNA polymerase sigma factor [Paenibacillus sabuli]MBD2845579.1 sigma-70 family RNA polymerase sigma factor [Paenibacillus sabuli]
MSSDAKFEYLKALTDSEDKKAILNELMTTYGKDVWNYAYSMTRKRELADDVTQDVFLKVYRSLFTFRSESSLKTWLLTITRNTVLDYRRSAYFRRITLVDYFTSDGGRPSAEDEAVKSETTSELWDLVLQLPAKNREAIILFAHHQLSMKEIADMLGVSVGTIKSRLHHARLKLSKLKERSQDGSQRQ